MATVVAINKSTRKGVQKDTIESGNFIVEFGLEGDAHGGDWHRQVSFLGQESIDKMIEKGLPDLHGGDFAENVTTEGICLYELPIGTQLQIADAVFEVTQIGKECHQKCAIYHKVGSCVMPHEGIFAIVKQGGVIRAGDEIRVIK